MFLGWDTFAKRLMQMYNNPENEMTAKQKFKELTQNGSVIDYTVQF